MADATDPKNEERHYFIDEYGSGLRKQKRASLIPDLLQKLKEWGYRKNISPEMGREIDRFETPTEPTGKGKER